MNAGNMLGMSIVSGVMLGVLGLLLIFILIGALFGMMRGGKRTLIRLATVVVGLSIALLMTPVFAKAFMGVKIPFGVNKTGGEYIEELLFESGTGADIAAAQPEIVDFTKACAVVLVSLVVFFLSYFIFKWLSWLVYFFLARKFAPKVKKTRSVDEEGKESFDEQKTKKSRWWGLGAGVLTGLVFFAFFMIPITGTLQTLDKMASYTPTFANYSSASSADDDGIKKTLNIIKDYNTQIQTSAAGRITKYTGIQGVGSWGVSYLSIVRAKKHSVNLRSDLIRIAHVAQDGMAVAADVQRDGDLITKFEKDWKQKDYEELKKIVDKVFKIGLVQLIFKYSEGVIDAIEENETLNGVGSFIEDEGDRAEFTSALYEGLRIMTMDNIKNDFKNAIDLMRLLFAEGYYSDIMEVVDATRNDAEDGAIASASTSLSDKLKKDGVNNIASFNIDNAAHVEKTNAYKLVNRLLGFKLFQELLKEGDEHDASALYRIPLAQVLKMDKEDVTFGVSGATNWGAVSVDGARLLINILGVVPRVIDIQNSVTAAEVADDYVGVLGDLDDELISSLAGVLDILTNSAGIGKFLRSAIAPHTDNLFEGIIDGINEYSDFKKEIDDMVEEMKEQIAVATDAIDELKAAIAAAGDETEEIEKFLADFEELQKIFEEYKEYLGDNNSALAEALKKIAVLMEGMAAGQAGIDELVAEIDLLMKEVNRLIAKVEGFVGKLEELKDYIIDLQHDLKPDSKDEAGKMKRVDWLGTIHLIKDIAVDVADFIDELGVMDLVA